MIKQFIPKVCPCCGYNLYIECGKDKDTIKLVCKNIDCSGVSLKKLQKGIEALEIRGIGPEVIKKLEAAGIKSSVDLFDKNKFNEKTLILSGEFKKGRALQKIIQAVDLVKQIPIEKLILSLQLKDVGKTFSEKIGQLFSNMTPDYTGLQLDIRSDIQDKNSILYKTIENSISKFEESGIEVIRFTPKVIKESKKINKFVSVSNFSTTEVYDIIEKLNWEIVPIEESQLLIIEDKDEKSEIVEIAKEKNIKIMTLKQIKIIFI